VPKVASHPEYRQAVAEASVHKVDR